jgi:phosphotransferase family enzyme
MTKPAELPAGIAQRIAELFPGARVTDVQPLAPDRAGGDPTTKESGYGVPRRVEIRDAEGQTRSLVYRTQGANDFGHDRRADRAEALLLAFDTFGRIPRHIRALDVGAIGADGNLVSVREGREFYLLTTFAPGRPYAEDLRRVAQAGEHNPLDLERCAALATYLVGLHGTSGGRPAVYTRAIRDLVGHGEGIFGVIDGYPPGVPAAPPERLHAIERRCLEWRWRLRDRADRLAPSHGDFHPFNVLFDKGLELSLLDASRGGAGDPADDVTCMAVNYIFFALDRPASWRPGLRPLWRRFWGTYLAGSGDRELLSCAAPFLAWRGLVLANPRFYPHVEAGARDKLLGFVERVLDAPALDIGAADQLFT